MPERARRARVASNSGPRENDRDDSSCWSIGPKCNLSRCRSTGSGPSNAKTTRCAAFGSHPTPNRRARSQRLGRAVAGGADCARPVRWRRRWVPTSGGGDGSGGDRRYRNDHTASLRSTAYIRHLHGCYWFDTRRRVLDSRSIPSCRREWLGQVRSAPPARNELLHYL